MSDVTKNQTGGTGRPDAEQLARAKSLCVRFVVGEPIDIDEVAEAVDLLAAFAPQELDRLERAALGGELAMVEYWQAKRGGGQRGIVEIVEETHD